MKIVLFDGVCNFCNASVNFIMKHDKRQYFKFCSQQSETGKELLREFSLPGNALSTIILLDEGKIYTKSSAILLICKYLVGYPKLFYVFSIIPLFIRDAIYDFIAKNRYKFFGKRESCRIPTAEERNRFLG